MSKVRRTAATAAATLLCINAGWAQEEARDSDGPPQLGPFDVGLSATATGQYNDNVYSTETGRTGDFVTILAPELTLRARSESFSLDLGAEAEAGFFATETSEDYTDAALRAEVEWIAGDRLSFFGGADYAWEHEERSSPEPDDANGDEPTEYREASGFAGLALDMGAVGARFGVNLRQLDFDDAPVAGEDPINNDDRDRLQTELGGRLSYELAKDSAAFAQGVYDLRRYDDAVDDNSLDRDSEGFNAAIGYLGRLGPFEGEVLVGVLHQTYDDPAFDDVTALDFGAELSWRPDPATRLSFEVDRRLEETTLNGSPGYLATEAVLRASRWVASDLWANAFLGYSENDYRGVDRTDYLGEAGFGLQYYLGPNVYLGAGYSYAQRTSDVPGADYESHTAYLRLGADLVSASRPRGAGASLAAGEVYGGLQFGDGLLKTSIEGARGSGGSLDAEFGDFGPSGGIFAGYRAEFGDFVLGVELDGWLNGADWLHEGNRSFSVEAVNSVGASLIAGSRIRNDVLLYARAGVVATEFETWYSLHGSEAEREAREAGMRIGFGAEFPVSARLSGRMEYSLTAYPDYDLASRPDREADNFNNVASLASIGLIYHFGAAEAQVTDPVDFGGFYAGVQAGHGGLATENSGPRPETEEPSFFLDVTRAGMGATGGIFAGYGHTFGPLYVGAEVEAELSNANWDIDRDPNGRLYSVEKQGSVGAALRAGYVINDSALIYGRAGVVKTWFDTDYAIGDEAGLSQSDSDIALRLGAGMEFAVSDSVRMRLDYTRTDYGTYTVDYGSGIDSFDNSENLFRVGLSYSF